MANGVWRETARRHLKAHYLLAAIFSDGFEIFKSQKDFCEIPASPGLRLTGDTHKHKRTQSNLCDGTRAEALYETNSRHLLGMNLFDMLFTQPLCFAPQKYFNVIDIHHH